MRMRMMKTMLMIMIVMVMKTMKTMIIYDNNDDDTAGSMLWNQWCERKANAMDFHQNEVGAH